MDESVRVVVDTAPVRVVVTGAQGPPGGAVGITSADVIDATDDAWTNPTKVLKTDEDGFVTAARVTSVEKVRSSGLVLQPYDTETGEPIGNYVQVGYPESFPNGNVGVLYPTLGGTHAVTSRTDGIPDKLNTGATTYALLGSASSVGAGYRAFITDCATATFLATASGGGVNKVPVVSDGTDWLVG